MYRHYNQAGDAGMPRSQINRNRIKNVIILLLLIALGAMVFIGLPALRSTGEMRQLYIQRAQSECDEAVRQTSSLSRSAGADSAAILAKIRSNIYSVRMINTLCSASGNGNLMADDELLSLQDMVDNYLTFITTGMDTGEYQTNLQNSLAALQEKVNALD